MNCYKCQSVEVKEEFERCSACETEHQELCKKLDSKPRPYVEKIREELIGFKEMRHGRDFTTYMTREEAAILGLKIPEEYAKG